VSVALSLVAKLVAGPLFDWLKQRGVNQVTRAEIEAELEKAIAAEQAKLVAAEISGNWLQRSWRPIVALTAFFSYWFVIVGYPFALAWGLLPSVRFGEQGLQNLFWLTVTCVGGYIGGRSLEKIMKKD
jgi:hypothetical protein